MYWFFLSFLVFGVLALLAFSLWCARYARCWSLGRFALVLPQWQTHYVFRRRCMSREQVAAAAPKTKSDEGAHQRLTASAASMTKIIKRKKHMKKNDKIDNVT